MGHVGRSDQFSEGVSKEPLPARLVSVIDVRKPEADNKNSKSYYHCCSRARVFWSTANWSRTGSTR
jgi:hypothetical protein